MAIYYGRYHNQSRPDWGFIAPGQMRAVTFGKTSQHLWVYQFGIWGGKNTNESNDNVSARIALYDTASLNPDDRLGYSAAFTVSTPMLDAVSGASHTANVAVVDVDAPNGATFKAIPVSSGYNYSLAVLGTGGYLSHGMIAASRIDAENERFYNRSGIGQPPPLDFGAYTSSNEGHIAIWAAADANVRPGVPNYRTPLGTVEEIVPVFSARFNDDNKNRGDYLNQYRIQCRIKGGATVWNQTYTATPAERSAAEISRPYGGTALVRGTAYEWRVQMSDHFGAWSDWSTWLEFTPAALGTITLDSSPFGKTEDNTPDFFGEWSHQTGASMVSAQIRIWNSAGNTVLQTGPSYNIAVNSGSGFWFTWANTGLSTLAWGTGYQYEMRGYDGTQWSDWSNKRTFRTNAAPSVPSGLSPSNGMAISSYPLLVAYASDADDTVATGLQVFARVKNSAGTVLGTVSMTYNSAVGFWEYQTSAADLAAYGTYRWDAYAYDGTLYSGEKTSVATANKSAEAMFVYAEGPEVIVSQPVDGETVTTSSIGIEWSTDDQVDYRVRMYADGSAAVVYDSGTIVSTTGSHIIPSGYVVNETAYDIAVSVTDSLALTGQSTIIDITVSYPPTDTINNFTVGTVNIGSDIWASAIRLNWDQTLYATDVWQDYTITRTAGTGEDAETIILARITSPTQTTFTDYTPASGVEYTYALTQTIMTGLDTLPSDPVTGSASVYLGGVVLVSVTDPTVLRTNLRYTREREFSRVISESVYEPLSGAKPTTVRERTFYKTPSFDFQLFADRVATPQARLAELEAIDEDGGTYCYRDNHGRKLFVTITELSITDQVPDWYTATIAMREVYFDEGYGKSQPPVVSTPPDEAIVLDGGIPESTYDEGVIDGGTP